MPSNDSNCGCPGRGESDTSKSPCQKPAKSENDCSKPKTESDCSKPKKTSSCDQEDQRCHSSHKKFKDQQKCGDSKSQDCKKSPKPSGDAKCHYSQTAFNLGRECPEQSNTPCSSQKLENPPCSSSKIDEPPCSSSKLEKPPCERSSLGEYGFIKLSDMCKAFASKALKMRPKSKCSGVDDAKKGPCLPPSRPPCDPAVEAGAGSGPGAKSPCVTKFSGPCPQAKKPSILDFFPIDARNKKLNDCIEKYTKINPNQVISKCSQFASQTSHVTEQCAQAVRRGQATCARTVRSSPAAQRTVKWLGPRHVQMAQRWMPTAAVYLATTALLTVYVTEWRAALRYVPFYQPSSPEGQDD